jgi:hypothetical protein
MSNRQATSARVGGGYGRTYTRPAPPPGRAFGRQPNDDKRARFLLGQALDAARNLGLGSVARQAVGLLKEDH